MGTTGCKMFHKQVVLFPCMKVDKTPPSLSTHPSRHGQGPRHIAKLTEGPTDNKHQKTNDKKSTDQPTSKHLQYSLWVKGNPQNI